MSGSEPVSVIGVPVLSWATATVCALDVGVPAVATLSVTVAAGLTLVPLLAVKVKLSGP